jgi:6-phosphogluconate dehydrogenase (decarboxylating)
METGFIGQGRMSAWKPTAAKTQDIVAGHFVKMVHNSIEYGMLQAYGEGRWTVQQAIDTDVLAPVTRLSLLEGFRSRQDESFTAKVIAALRNEFGGYAVKASEKQ